jgi:hypothetical protein
VPLRDTAGAAFYVCGFVAAELVLIYFRAASWGCWVLAGAILTILALAILIAVIVIPEFARTVREATLRKHPFEVGQPAPNLLR